MILRNLILRVLAVLVVVPAFLCSADLRQAVIVLPTGVAKPQQKAAQMLSEEIEKRTQLRLKIVPQLPASGPAIVLGQIGKIRALRLESGRKLPESGPADGFTVMSSGAGTRPLVIVAGNDDRGVVFGAGYLLRNLHMGRQRLELGDDLNVTTAPKVPIRGHQLGYRPKTNAYDAWSVPMWEQYIRELAIFGVPTMPTIAHTSRYRRWT